MTPTFESSEWQWEVTFANAAAVARVHFNAPQKIMLTKGSLRRSPQRFVATETRDDVVGSAIPHRQMKSCDTTWDGFMVQASGLSTVNITHILKCVSYTSVSNDMEKLQTLCITMLTCKSIGLYMVSLSGTNWCPPLLSVFFQKAGLE